MKKLALKDLKLFFADKRAMMLTFLVPIALITLFAFAFGGVGHKKGESKPTTLVVADDDNTAASRNVMKQLDSSREFVVEQKSAAEAENLVKKGDEAAVLILHKGLADSLNAGNRPPVELKYDAAEEAAVGMLKGALIGSLIRIVGGKSMAKSTLAKIDFNSTKIDFNVVSIDFK